MKTVWDVKKAHDLNTMVRITQTNQKERQQARRRKEAEKAQRQAQRKKVFVWQDIFPACVCR